jgi:purine-binding chemotaxis protein CheW
MTETLATRAQAGKYLTFALANERYGIDILKVQEIISVPTITRVPRAPDHIRGVMNLRGRIVPVSDLRLRLGFEERAFNERTCVIVVNVSAGGERLLVGLIVDTVLEVVEFKSSEVETTPQYGTSLDAQLILGIARRSNNPVVILLDIEEILKSCLPVAGERQVESSVG